MLGRATLGSLLTLGTLAASSMAVGCRADPSPPRPQHVLLLVIDTLRADHLSAWGYERPTSPNIDALARRGVRFSRAVSQCSWTSPSMVSLMTGRYLAGPRLDIPGDVPSLAELFQAAGYATAGFISNPLLDEKAGFHRGFDRVQHIPPYQPDAPIVEWIEGQAGVPTFTYVHLNEAHDPYQPPEGTHRWLLDPPPIPAERLAHYREAVPDLVDDAGLKEIRRSLAGYDDDILYTDQRIGALVGALEGTSQFESSLIVVTADHGEGLWTRMDYFNGPRGQRQRDGEPPSITTSYKMTHGNQVSPELVHIPLILVAPSLMQPPAAGRTVSAWVENVDVGPTLLELCDLADPGGMQGESLMRALENSDDWSRTKPVVFSATRFVLSVISQDGWQLVLPTLLGECQEGLIVELFDLNTDPQARHNLASSEPQRVAELTELVRARQASGLPGHVDPNQVTMDDLRELGYAGNGIIDQVPEEVRELSTSELLARLASPDATCLQRLIPARVLATRTLEASEEARLDEILALEASVVIRRIFRK